MEINEFNSSNEADCNVDIHEYHKSLAEYHKSLLLSELKRQAAKDLELLTQMICDRFSPRLKSEMERRGFHQSDRIFSHQMIAIHPIDSAQKAALSSLKAEQAEVLERLAQEIEQLLYHRLIYERERLGRFMGCLPW
jgi:hypothetical protein